MHNQRRRLDRLERRAPAAAPAPPAVDMDAVYRKLEAVGLACWDAAKGGWSPTDARLLEQFLAERRANTEPAEPVSSGRAGGGGR